MLYCPVCKVVAYRNHKCPPNNLVPIKKELREIVDQLYRLNMPVLSAVWFSFPVLNSYYEHRITFNIELVHNYPTSILDLPSGWQWYTETVTDDHFPLSCIGYSEVYVWLGDMTVEERVSQIVKVLVDYLATRDPAGIKSIMLLSE